MYNLSGWLKKQPRWSKEALQLLQKSSLTPTPNINLEEFLQKSEEFPIAYPIDTIRCKVLKDSVTKDILERNINSAYPLIHENALFLYAQFILHKREYGNAAEKQLYKEMTILSFIQRLLTKRPVMYLTLGKCLSYDEIKLSVFVSISSYSYFINDGTRENFGNVSANRSNIQDEGVVIGIVGAKLKKVGEMEYEETVVTKTQNTEQNGYGAASNTSLHSVFANFYEEPCFTYEHMLEQKKNEPRRFTDVGIETFFDNVVYAKRIALSIDTLLLEANHRAKQKNTMAYIHVVGIGLGVWKCSAHQEVVFVETFANRLQSLGKELSSISDVHFAYFNETKSCGGFRHGEVMNIQGHPEKGIKIYISKKDPHTKLTRTDAGKLLVVSYAWDGNALPGIEFWSKEMGFSGHSAAAASTQISEVHNVHINPKVCASNVQIVTSSGLVSFDQYRQNITDKR